MNATTVFLTLIVMIAVIGGILSYFIYKPYNQRRFDASTKFIDKKKALYISSIGFLFVAIIVYFLTQLWNGNAAFIHLVDELDKSKEASHVIFSLPDQLDIDLFNFISLIFIGMLIVLGCVAYYTTFIIHTVIRHIKSFLYQRDHEEIHVLLRELRNKYFPANVQSAVRAYYEIKNSGSKDKLYISQWEEVVRYLLLVGDVEEAESLNRYLHERSNYARYTRDKMFESKYKVALFDINQMEIDRHIAKKRVQKLPKDVQKKINIFE